MNTKEAIGLITFGIGIGGAIATAVVGKLGYDYSKRQFADGVEFGIALKKIEVTLERFEEENKNKNNSEHNE